jgi:hypothetical protein
MKLNRFRDQRARLIHRRSHGYAARQIGNGRRSKVLAQKQLRISLPACSIIFFNVPIGASTEG